MSLGLEVKTVSLDNLADLRALDQDSFPEPWSRSLWKLELSRPNRIYLGAFKGAELIGFIGGLLAHTDFHIVLGTGMDGDLELVHARTIVEARRLLEEYTFDLIIIDRMLKDGEGLDLIKYVPNPDKTKIVVVTARDENIHHIYVDDILVKSRNRPGDFVNRFAVIVDEIKERKRCA